MRTDAKVGLICALALTIAVVAYFVMQHDPASSNRATESTSGLTTEAPASPAPSGTPVASSDVAAAPGSITTPGSSSISSPPPAYTPSIAQVPQTPPSLVISPPAATAPTPTGPLQITPPGSSPRGLLPPTTPTGSTATAPSPTSSGTPAGGGSGPYMPPSSSGTGPTSTIEISPSDRPRDSLLEHTTPRSTIGTGGGDSSVFGANTLTGGNTYAIQNGDTLSSIAKKNNTTVKALEAANPRIDPNHLKIKQVINLPAPGSSTPASTGTITSTGATTRPSRASAHSGSSSTAATRPAAAAPGTTYTVKKGDTLRKIAKTVYGDEAQWKQIARANRSELDDPNDLEPGMTLKLPPK